MDFRRQMNDFLAQTYRQRYTADKLCGLYRAEERAAAAMGAEQFAMMVEMTRKFTDSFEKEIRNGAE